MESQRVRHDWATEQQCSTTAFPTVDFRPFLENYFLKFNSDLKTSMQLEWLVSSRLFYVGLFLIWEPLIDRCFTFTFHFYALEKEMATHSSVLAWRIPGMGSHRVGHNWSDLAVAVLIVWHYLLDVLFSRTILYRRIIWNLSLCIFQTPC